MFAPTTEVVDGSWNRISIQNVLAGRELIGRTRGRLATATVARAGVGRAELSCILVTAYGRRLHAAASQRVLLRTPRCLALWRRMGDVKVGNLVYVADGGILALDRVTCVVLAEGHEDLWITVTTDIRTLCAEEILCRAN